MWAYGHHFHTEDVNGGCVTLDCGMEVKFDQSSHASHHYQNIIEGRLGYVRKIQEIMKVGFTLFPMCYFRCKWWNTYNQNNVKEDHDSRLICTNSRKMWDATKEPYVFPKHSNQEFFYLDLLDRDWWFVLRHSPKSKHIFANNNVIMPSEEYNLGDGSRE